MKITNISRKAKETIYTTVFRIMVICRNKLPKKKCDRKFLRQICGGKRSTTEKENEVIYLSKKSIISQIIKN